MGTIQYSTEIVLVLSEKVRTELFQGDSDWKLVNFEVCAGRVAKSAYILQHNLYFELWRVLHGHAQFGHQNY